MSRSDRSMALARRRPSPVFDRLEGRLLLNATPATHHEAPAVHAMVEITAKPTHHAAAKPTHHHAAKLEHAAKVGHAASKPAKASAHVASRPIKIHSKLIDLRVVAGPKRTGGYTNANYSPVPGAYNPTQLETAYGVNLLGLANQGQGVTIGIVDEYNDANITADANAYSAQYKLPKFDGLNGDPTLSVYEDTTFGAVGSAKGTGVAIETSLDVEMAHAMAPKANILLVEVPAPNPLTLANLPMAFAEILHGGQYAAGRSVNGAPVVVVSTSYGFDESAFGDSNVQSLDSTYLATGASTNVAMTVSTADHSTPGYPGTSPNVIAVGGTALYLASARGRYSLETAWGGLDQDGAGGGGPSLYFSQPSYQTSNGVTAFGTRAVPDVSMNADGVTGVSIYDSLDGDFFQGGDPWFAVGGTSEASPLFAGILALVQQDRRAAGSPILNSTEIDTALYEAYNSPAYSTLFHDVILGNNSNVDSSGQSLPVAGYDAAKGYDLATGIGSPIANTLVPYLTKYTIGT